MIESRQVQTLKKENQKLRKEIEKLKKLTVIDLLTQLYNRRAFSKHLNKAS